MWTSRIPRNWNTVIIHYTTSPSGFSTYHSFFWDYYSVLVCVFSSVPLTLTRNVMGKVHFIYSICISKTFTVHVLRLAIYVKELAIFIKICYQK